MITVWTREMLSNNTLSLFLFSLGFLFVLSVNECLWVINVEAHAINNTLSDGKHNNNDKSEP